MKKINLLILVAIIFTFSYCTEQNLFEQEENVNLQQDDTLTELNKVNVREVDIEEARQELEIFLSEFDNSNSISKSNEIRKISSEFTLISKTNLSKSSCPNDDKKIAVHVFNFENNKGFALMSATTATPPLLALTESGNIDTIQEIENLGLIIVLENIEKYLRFANDSTINDSSQIDNERSNTISKRMVTLHEFDFYTPKTGYCTVHWHQDTPYNQYCHNNNFGETFVGCVPVAVAQLLSTYRFPKTYNNYEFDWNKMISDNKDPNIARLMQQLGIPRNLNVKYGDKSKREGSNSSINNIPRTLKNLGFKNGGNVVAYDTDKVIEQLKQKKCVIVAGHAHKTNSKTFLGIRIKKPSYEFGHDWLIHGAMLRRNYQKSTHSTKKTFKGTDTYVLCNFGWENTSSDGYYLSGIFDTNQQVEYTPNQLSKKNTEQDYNYQYNLRILINVER